MSPTIDIPVTHVIFDLDGTLLDTESAFVEVQAGIFSRFGMSLPEEVRLQMMGRPTRVAVPLMLELTGLPMTAEEYIATREALLVDRFANAPAMPGAVALTAHLRRHGIPQAVATSSTQATFELKAQGHPEWLSSFEAIVTSDDIEHGKPAPDIFLHAAELLGARPEACLVLEDAPIGVEAGLAAGMRVVALPAPGHESAVAGAHVVLPSLEAFEPEAWGLPAFG